MDDLIRRGALLAAMGLETATKYGNKSAEQQHNSYSTWMSYEIADEINGAPSVDAVEVVRCRDCKNSGMMVPIGGKRPNRICWLHDLQVTDKDFCSFGARMDAQTDGEKEAKQDG